MTLIDIYKYILKYIYVAKPDFSCWSDRERKKHREREICID